MQTVILNTDAAGTTTRSFLPISESAGNVIFETRDQDRRSLESAMTLSSTHLNSKATKVASKLQHKCINTVDGVAIVSAQNLVKFEAVISDDASIADRIELASMAISAAEAFRSQMEDLTPVYL